MVGTSEGTSGLTMLMTADDAAWRSDQCLERVSFSWEAAYLALHDCLGRSRPGSTMLVIEIEKSIRMDELWDRACWQHLKRADQH